MKKANVRIKRWDGGLGIRIPASIIKAARFSLGQRVLLSVLNGRLALVPVSHPDETLAERLARFDPIRHGGETMTVSKRSPLEP
jgi:antitoxin MazE